MPPKKIKKGARVLPLYALPLKQILEKKKDVETRGAPTHKIDETIYLSLVGDGRVHGQATIHACLGPLSQAEWDALRPRHLVEDPQPWYGERTHAWVLTNVIAYAEPVPFTTRGGQTWQVVS